MLGSIASFCTQTARCLPAGGLLLEGWLPTENPVLVKKIKTRWEASADADASQRFMLLQ